MYITGRMKRGKREVRMKKLLIVSYTSSVKDPRVFKEWAYLHNDFDITIAGWKPVIPDVDFIEIRKGIPSLLDKIKFGLGMLFGNLKPFLDSFEIDMAALKDRTFDLVLCNDLYPLPLAFRLAKGAPVFWDAHEYYPEEHEDSFLWRMVFKRSVMKIAGKYIPMVAGMSTVSPAIADRYRKEYGKEPVLVRNIPVYHDCPPGKNSGPVRLIHHGDAHPSRKLEKLIEMMKLLGDGYTLDFMLIAHERYQAKLKKMAAGMKNIHFIPSVPLNSVVEKVNQYDIGIHIIPAINFNHAKCLPNKFFEYMQASLALMIGPSSEMAAIIGKYGNGIVASDFTPESLAQAIRKYSPDDIQKMKSASYQAAKQMTAEADYQLMKQQLLRISKS